VREYDRHISRGQAISLGRLYLVTRQALEDSGWVDGTPVPPLPFFHLPTVIGRRSSEEHKLVSWGLIEEERIFRPDGGRAGYWRITLRGRAYVLGLLSVPYTAVTGPRNTLVRFDGPLRDIHAAYGEPFDLRNI
jgi:hypothetical protein